MGFGDVKMLAMIGAFLGLKLVILTFVLVVAHRRRRRRGAHRVASRPTWLERRPVRDDAGRGGARRQPAG